MLSELVERVNFPQIPHSTDFFPSTLVSTPGGACVFWGQLHFFPSCRTDGTSGTCDWLGDACSWSFPALVVVGFGESSMCSRAWPGPLLLWSSFSRPQPQPFPSFSPFSLLLIPSSPIHPHSLVLSYPSTFLSSAWCCLSSNLSLPRSLKRGLFFSVSTLP